jgi:HSP20 family protein
MARSVKVARKQEKQLGYFDDIFENFRKEIESALKPWHAGFGKRLPFDAGIRMPLYDITDKGDAFELNVEVPGIQKEKINVKATGNFVEVAAEQSEKSEEKRKNYLYTERSHKSFYRKIPVPEEIVPSKTDARMNNGVLVVKLAKKKQKKSKNEVTIVEVK